MTCQGMGLNSFCMCVGWATRFFSRSHAPAWECRGHRANGAGRYGSLGINSFCRNYFLVPTRQRGNAVSTAPAVLDGMVV
jgi:hypothetical protein